jgi:hypothetical protein
MALDTHGHRLRGLSEPAAADREADGVDSFTSISGRHLTMPGGAFFMNIKQKPSINSRIRKIRGIVTFPVVAVFSSMTALETLTCLVAVE